jgi:hypothetical protein
MALAKRGPKTEAGKLVAAMNSTRHGILSPKPVVAAFETAHGWNAHRESILDSLKPEGGVEQALAERVALNSWRLNRVVVYETEAINGLQDGLVDELRKRARVFDGLLEDNEEDPDEIVREAEKRHAVYEDLLGVYRETSEKLVSPYTASWTLEQAPFFALQLTALEKDPNVDLDEAEYDMLGAADKLDGKLEKVLAELDDAWSNPESLRKALRWVVDEVGMEGDEHYSGYEGLMEKLCTVAEHEANQAGEKVREVEKTLASKRRARILPNETDLQKISRYEAHLSRQMYQALHELEALQARRGGKAAPLARVDVQT